MRRLYIWGRGEIGGRIIRHLNDNWNIVFVDSNEQLVGSNFHGKEVIGIEEYIKYYSNEFILIAHLCEMESIALLKEHNITNYFVYSDLPGEFLEPCFRDELKKYIISYLGGRENFVIYGLNLYSIIIDNWLFERYGIHPSIYVHGDKNTALTDKIEQKYQDLRLIRNISQLNSIEEICISTSNYKEILDAEDFKVFQLTDIFDCSDKIGTYHNPLIEKFHNMHEGKRCFIVATGPSLKMEDLDLLHNREEICISMNSIFHAFEKTSWRPNYYVALDYRVLDAVRQAIDGWSVEASFISDDSDAFWKIKHKKNVYKYHQTYDYHYDRCPKFSEDFSRRSYMGATVTYTCLQLAVYMGFKEIYLLGVDFTNGDQKKNVSQPHFYNEEQDKRDYEIYYNVAHTEHIFHAYLATKKYADLYGIKIFNATRGGELEIFERVDFDSLFSV